MRKVDIFFEDFVQEIKTLGEDLKQLPETVQTLKLRKDIDRIFLSLCNFIAEERQRREERINEMVKESASSSN